MATRKPSELLHHSDQGSQCSSEDFQRLLSAHGITCSMSRQGDCWDTHCAVESFFASLKKERVHRKPYTTRGEARGDILDFVEVFYNTRRRHSTPGQVSPAEFERSTGLSACPEGWAEVHSSLVALIPNSGRCGCMSRFVGYSLTMHRHVDTGHGRAWR